MYHFSFYKNDRQLQNSPLLYTSNRILSSSREESIQLVRKAELEQQAKEWTATLNEHPGILAGENELKH